ncbi:MAG: hypothetical protein WC145_13095 [Aliarcobacter sp.]|jgi:hypothetical protein|nr:hypothetical protein [Methanothrix sp.]
MSLIDEIHGALRPSSEPITATLSEVDDVTAGFVSRSSIAPVTVLLSESVDFQGSIGYDIKLGETWYPFWVEAQAFLVPEGCEVRVRLYSVSVGSVVATIFQGRVT